MQRVIDIVLCIRRKVKFSNFMEMFQRVISFMDTTYLKSSQLTNIKIPRGVDSACAEESRVSHPMAKSVFAAFLCTVSYAGELMVRIIHDMTLSTARPHSLMIGHQNNACKYKGHHRNQRLAFYLSLLFST